MKRLRKTHLKANKLIHNNGFLKHIYSLTLLFVLSCVKCFSQCDTQNLLIDTFKHERFMVYHMNSKCFEKQINSFTKININDSIIFEFYKDNLDKFKVDSSSLIIDGLDSLKNVLYEKVSKYFSDTVQFYVQAFTYYTIENEKLTLYFFERFGFTECDSCRKQNIKKHMISTGYRKLNMYESFTILYSHSRQGIIWEGIP